MSEPVEKLEMRAWLCDGLYGVTVPILRTSFMSDKPVRVSLVRGDERSYAGPGYCLDVGGGMCIVAESDDAIVLGFDSTDYITARNMVHVIVRDLWRSP